MQSHRHRSHSIHSLSILKCKFANQFLFFNACRKKPSRQACFVFVPHKHITGVSVMIRFCCRVAPTTCSMFMVCMGVHGAVTRAPSWGRALASAGFVIYAGNHWGVPCTISLSRPNQSKRCVQSLCMTMSCDMSHSGQTRGYLLGKRELHASLPGQEGQACFFFSLGLTLLCLLPFVMLGLCRRNHIDNVHHDNSNSNNTKRNNDDAMMMRMMLR